MKKALICLVLLVEICRFTVVPALRRMFGRYRLALFLGITFNVWFDAYVSRYDGAGNLGDQIKLIALWFGVIWIIGIVRTVLYMIRQRGLYAEILTF